MAEIAETSYLLTPAMVELLQDVLDGKRIVLSYSITTTHDRPRQLDITLTVEDDHA